MVNFYTDCRIHKGRVLYRGWENGERVERSLSYRPYLFLKSDRETGFKTLEGQNVEKKEFGSIREARDFVNNFKDIDNFKYWGLTNYEYVYLYDQFPKKVEFDKKQISIGSIDIEVMADEGFESPQTAKKEITLITIRKNGFTWTFGCRFYKNENPNVEYNLCRDESDLLKKFIQVWQQLDLDVVTGWNIEGYDIVYLINRIINVLSEDDAKKLSPWGVINAREFQTRYGTEQRFDILGISVLDYLDLYKKFSYKNQESYKLDYIANVELEKQKLDYSDYKNLHDFYEKNFQKYTDYNILDAQLVDELEDKLGFLNIVFSLAYLYKCNYNDTLATVKPWDICIHNYLLDQGIVIPQFKKGFASRQIVGGFVKEPVVGKYSWIGSFDIKSSYPHQIMQCNISPETLVCKKDADIDEYIDILNGSEKNTKTKRSLEYAKTNNLVMAGNGTMYRKDKKGFIPVLVESFFNQRAEYEKLLEQTEKELQNIEEEIKRRNI